MSLLCPPVFVTLSCTFRYGRDDMDVIGIAFRRELYLSTRQVYPPLQDREKGIHSKTQARLLRKLGNNAYPFFFEVRVRLWLEQLIRDSESGGGFNNGCSRRRDSVTNCADHSAAFQVLLEYMFFTCCSSKNKCSMFPSEN